MNSSHGNKENQMDGLSKGVVLVLLFSLIVAFSCERNPTRVGDSAPVENNVFWILSNAQLQLGRLRIGAGNFWESECTDEKGKEVTGLTTGLWIYVKGQPETKQTMRVHPGQRFTAGNKQFEVYRIKPKSIGLRLIKTD